MDNQTKFEEVVNEPTITLRVSDNLFNRLVQRAKHEGFRTVEAYCEFKMIQNLERNIGEPHINSPSMISGVSAQKITGPSWSQK